jgi:hypothetical protein
VVCAALTRTVFGVLGRFTRKHVRGVLAERDEEDARFGK